ncbi:hypothetical protein ACFX13_045174 [Malus domestica]
MPSTHNQGSSSPLTSIGRSIWSRREPFQSEEANQELSELELEVQSFQKLVTDLFHDLSAAGADKLLSIAWIRKLLDFLLAAKTSSGFYC